MFRPTEASVSHSNLSAMVPCDFMNSALFFTYLQSIGERGESGETDRSSPVAPGPTSPKDSGAGIASPEVVLSGIPRPAPRTTRLWDEDPTSSLG
jgi:hypothetical protein